MTSRIVIAFAVIVTLSANALGDKGEEDIKKMKGTWIPTSAELAGQKFPDETLKTMKLTLEGDKYTVLVGDKKDEGTFKLDADKNPKTMDITGTAGPNQGKTFLTIYEFKDDSLKVCYDLSGKVRPTQFKTEPNTQLFLVTYKREKS